MASQFEGTHLSCTTPPYAMPPFTYEDNRTLAITFKTSADVLRVLVPEPLVVNADNLMTIYVGELNAVHPKQISYYEAGVMIPASYGSDKGCYMPVLYLDKILPITIGREVFGYPKFQADLSMEVKDGVVHASVMSEGTSLIDATLHMGAPIPPRAFSPRSTFLMKAVPSVTGGSMYDVKHLTTAVLRDEQNTDVRPGKATIRLGSTESDPLGGIPVLEIVSGVYYIGGFALDYGRVVYDYLAKE